MEAENTFIFCKLVAEYFNIVSAHKRVQTPSETFPRYSAAGYRVPQLFKIRFKLSDTFPDPVDFRTRNVKQLFHAFMTVVYRACECAEIRFCKCFPRIKKITVLPHNTQKTAPCFFAYNGQNFVHIGDIAFILPSAVDVFPAFAQFTEKQRILRLLN